MLRRTLFAVFAALLVAPASAEERFITVASTTAPEESGLFRHILPLFRQQTGIEVRVVVVGTGRALQIGMKGEADAVMVHDRLGEERFVAEGHGLDRRDVMFNDFVIVGPATDPAHIRGLRDASDALQRIARSKSLFLSQGDDSGTHREELRLWTEAGFKRVEGEWYKEVGQSTGPTIHVAAGLNAYALTDRATWATFQDRRILDLLVAGDPELYNPYSSILVNPAKGAHIKEADARTWHEWLTSSEGRRAISTFHVRGEQLFFLPGTLPPL
ncbi:MAG TPA: substrate-binding domain-containing protein [Microvirga sp.]|jgi:tungstate transport system substrate-binding protein|nr:substrate-binding domain-containing protein [Microvirga sp.]